MSQPPHFLIIGGQRCGTSHLHRVLAQHPQLNPSPEKEIHYFDVYFDNSPSWYENQLQPIGGTLSYEATPCYLYYPRCAERAFRYNPRAKLIALLRDPVQRAWSHYCHERRMKVEWLPFGEALQREAERLECGGSFAADHFSYIGRSRYGEQLERWLEYFDRDDILCVKSELLFYEPAVTLDTITKFVGADRFAWERADLNKTQSKNMKRMSRNVRNHPFDELKRDNRLLRALMGNEF